MSVAGPPGPATTSTDVSSMMVEHDGGPPDQVLDALVAGMSAVLGDDLVAVWLRSSSLPGPHLWFEELELRGDGRAFAEVLEARLDDPVECDDAFGRDRRHVRRRGWLERKRDRELAIRTGLTSGEPIPFHRNWCGRGCDDLVVDAELRAHRHRRAAPLGDFDADEDPAETEIAATAIQ